jgi:hypothetical protein
MHNLTHTIVLFIGLFGRLYKRNGNKDMQRCLAQCKKICKNQELFERLMMVESPSGKMYIGKNTRLFRKRSEMIPGLSEDAKLLIGIMGISLASSDTDVARNMHLAKAATFAANVQEGLSKMDNVLEALNHAGIIVDAIT